MNIFSHLNIKKIFSKLAIMLLFIFLTIGLSACNEDYQNMTITLSNNGAEVIVYLEDGVSSRESINVIVNAGDNISKEIIASSDSSLLNIFTEYNENNSSTITITANGVCKNVLVNISTVEGKKTASFYVSVVIPVNTLNSTTAQTELFAIKGETKTLNEKLVQYSPANTTQKDLTYSLVDETLTTARITNNELYISPEYALPTIAVKAKSAEKESVFTEITLNVLQPINDSIELSANYSGTATEVDLDKTILFTKNVAPNNSIDITVKVNSPTQINIMPYIKSTVNQKSNIIKIVSGQIDKTETYTAYTFTINTETITGEDTFYFVITYVGYGYKYTTEDYNVYSYDVVKSLNYLVDGLVPDTSTLIVYDKYFGVKKGLQLEVEANPTVLPESEKYLILTLQNNATSFNFFDELGNEITFTDGTYEFLSGEKLFISAKTGNTLNGLIKISSKSNPDIMKIFTLDAETGTETLTITNSQKNENNYDIFYLTSNEVMTQDVEFFINNNDAQKITIETSGNAFIANKNIFATSVANTYKITVSSVKNAESSSGLLVIRSANGRSASAIIDVFKQIDESAIIFNASGIQESSSVGKMQRISHQSSADSPNLQFSVAVKKGSSISLVKNVLGATNIEYSFNETLLGESSAYASSYANFEQISILGGVKNLTYSNESTILKANYLSNFSEIYAFNSGKVWVKASVYGFALENSLKTTKNYDYYFIVEVYVPITNFALSQTTLNLYALNSLGITDKDKSQGTININLTQDATYNNIEWTSSYGLNYSLNNQAVYAFKNDRTSITLNAFSTLVPYEESGTTLYKNTNILTFYFVAKVQEFGSSYYLTLKLNINKAQQVEKILVLDVNKTEGIYIPLKYDGIDIVRQITAEIQIGESNIEPYNSELIYEFLPFAEIYKDALSIDSKTGKIVVKGTAKKGGSGIIRIAPADRYTSEGYVAGENDVAVYIPITIADGESRETSFRISSANEITNPNLHYTLMNNITINSENDFALMAEFNGGLYGTVKGENDIASISTNKTLFGTLTNKATIEDLIVVGNVSGNSFISNTNNGTIKNVVIDTQIINNVYSPSVLTSTSSDYVGSIAGVNNGTIDNCSFFGKIVATGAIAGGIAGQNNGKISNCVVELYNFANIENADLNTYASINGGLYAGGLVGEMTSGTLLNSYIYSYAYEKTNPANYLNLNIIFGTNIGAIVGNLTSGQVDICFAYANDIDKITGNDYSGNLINNAYVLYNVNNESISGKYIKNYAITQPSTIRTDNIWKLDSTKNYGLPFFIGCEQTTPLQSIENTLTTTEDNIVSIENKSVIYYYATTSSLTMQEIFAINNLNSISFDILLGKDASGIRAISSDNNVISVVPYGIVVSGIGHATLTLLSKYDYTLNQTYDIFVVYPIIDFTLSNNGNYFGNGAELNTKITQNFNVKGLMTNSIILDQFSVELYQNDSELELTQYTDYISGSKLDYIYDISSIYDDTNLSSLTIPYALTLNNENLSTYLTDINSILASEFSGNFNINLYKGADKIELASNAITIETNDEIIIEANILSDIPQLDENSLEDIMISVENVEYENILNIQKEYVSSTYFTSKTDLTQTTTNIEDAVYFKHYYKIKITIKDEYKHNDFNETKINCLIFAKSSLKNSQNYNANLVSKMFEITLNSQSVISLSSSHYVLTDKNLIYDAVQKTNTIYYTYSQSATSVLTPGDEGLLKVSVYPDFANYDYFEITYIAKDIETELEEDAPLRFGIMTKQPNGTFIRSNRGFNTIQNGIKIFNNYFYSSQNAFLENLYISTYVPASVDKDTIFIITIKAIKENIINSEIVKTSKSATFNLIVQYLEGAEITVQNANGTNSVALARGSNGTLTITAQKEQTLENVVINGLDTSNNNIYNFFNLSAFLETEIENSTQKKYVASINIGEELMIFHNANYITIEATVSWVINGKQQFKTTSFNLAVVDFLIDEIKLLTDKETKDNLNAYVGIKTDLKFDFNGFGNTKGNESFNEFMTNFYFQQLSNINTYGDYIVNYENTNINSFLTNIYYDDGTTFTPVLNTDGTINSNSYFTFNVKDGTISITGKRKGIVQLSFILPVKLPHETKTIETEIKFDFSITITEYSDEDTPIIIDSETAFYEALTRNTAENYILMTDLYLSNHTPQNTTQIASLDGNNHTINILSYNTENPSASLNLALFNIIDEKTTLKNLVVNTYHASSISIDTSITTEIQISGLAIENNGIIYNCEVVAYQADLTKKAQEHAGILVSYSGGQISSNINSTISGFVITNDGYITNSRVGGETLLKVNSGNILLNKFEISGQGDIAGFVYENEGSIASSYFANGTITNSTVSAIETRTSGFVSSNIGKIHTSYVKGVGKNSFTLTDGGISTSSICAGFAFSNSGVIGDSYANILLATTASAFHEDYESGRLTSGFIYQNSGTIERCYTASKIEKAKNTQTAFLGVDESGNMLNSGTIENSYYYAVSAIEGDKYTSTNEKISIKRITEPDNQEYFYGFAFSDDASAVNGVWYTTAYGVELVSANQIAVSHRYLANVQRNSITNELEKYDLPYTSGYEYGSINNPIIIRSANEFNTVFGGNTSKVGTAVASYYDDTRVFGNYRLITDIDLLELATSTSGVKIGSSDKCLDGGIFDGNMFTISGLDLSANADSEIQNYGLFAKLSNNAIIMNLEINVVSVYGAKSQCVGAVAGTVENSKLINIELYTNNQTETANVLGKNIVGGLVGKVIGDSQVKNITANSISVKASTTVNGSSQSFSRSYYDANSSVSYAGGIIGVADIYVSAYASDYNYDNAMQVASLSFLKTEGNMQIYGSTVGGVVGYMGARTFLKDATLELSSTLSQKLIAYDFFAGGVVGENYGDIEMAKTQHQSALQKTIEENISLYYQNPSSTDINRGNLTLFQDTNGKYGITIGGLVGQMNSGKIYHSYSKVNVISSYAKFAGGAIGQIPYSTNANKNMIDLYEVYAFGDVMASSTNAKAGAGGIVGYIDFTRKLTFNKVNAVNFWSLVLNKETNTYSLPTNAFMIYASTGTNSIYLNKQAELLSTIVNSQTGTMYASYNEYSLPTISCSKNTDDICAVNIVKFNNGKDKNAVSTNVKKSFASISSNNYYDMVSGEITEQLVVPFYDLQTPSYNGTVMDNYFIEADWDSNYWVRYAGELLPKLVMYNESNNYYIDKAEDLQKIIRYPNATFIVRALESPTTIINIGSYLKSSGIDFSSIVFTGVLKGLDNTLNYGFDFGNYSLPFFENTTSAKIYNLTIKNMGSPTSAYNPISTSFVNTANSTSFENLVFSNCMIFASANTDLNNIGIMANEMNGGYISNITFIDCAVNILASSSLDSLNVGFMAGKIKTQGNAFMQLADITAYNSAGFINASFYNDINVDTNGKQISNLNIGSIAGVSDGSLLLNYTTLSSSSNVIKGIGVANKLNQTFTADSAFNGLNSGLVIDVKGNGIVDKYNSGLVFGEVNNLNMSYQRTSANQKLYIVGGFLTSGSAVISNANVGGIIGKSNTNVSISNGAEFKDKFVVVDADLAFTANKINAGMLIGSSATINSIDNIDTYGTINIKANDGGTNLGGFVGVSNNAISISNAVSNTAITYNDEENTNFSNIGGLVGLFNSTTSSLTIGESDFNTKYLGTIVIKGKNVNVGGLLGGVVSSNSSLSGEDKVQIFNSVFGGDIIIDSIDQLYAGGILGTANTTSRVGELQKVLVGNLSYGDITINCDLSEKANPSYIGGLLGKGSVATHINGNNSICTISTQTTDITEKMNINALVGAINGSLTDSNATNYYSNQVSLCIDYNHTEVANGFACENIYYNTNNGEDNTQPVMLTVLNDYKNQLTDLEKAQEVYEGSKIFPIKVDNTTYNDISNQFASDYNGLKKYFVITGEITPNTMSNISLKNSHIIGDGFTLLTSQNAIFENIDFSSIVSGIKVSADITTNITSEYSVGGIVATGAGVLANVNSGIVYACNASEQQSAKVFNSYGIKNTLSRVHTGGLVGVNGGKIIDCCSDVDIETSDYAGGLVGLNNGIINNSYSTGIVNSPNSFSFGQGTVNGKVYNSYTASMAKNGTSAGAGVFGNNTTIGCYYDLYATTVFDSVSTAVVSDTDTMATIQNTDEKEIFLTNPTASEKFAYDFTKNYGYLSFSGDAYSNFAYLQNTNTGDGTNADNALLINNVGKLQQINNATQSNYYQLINDLNLTADIKTYGEEDYGVAKWKAIGTDTSTAFIGHFTGKYEDNGTIKSHMLTDINEDAIGTNFSAVFGATNNAFISDLAIENTTLNSTTVAKLSSLVAESSNTEIKNISVNMTSLTGSATMMGALVADAKGTTIISDCSVNDNFTITHTSNSGGGENYIGGLVGKLGDNASLTSCSLGQGFVVEYTSRGSVFAGGLVGYSVGASQSNKVVVEDNTISGGIELNSTQSTSSVIFGAVVGKAISSTISNIEIDGAGTFSTVGGESYFGGLVGYGDDATISDIDLSDGYAFDYNNTNSSDDGCFGGIIGLSKSSTISNIELGSNYTFNYSASSKASLGGMVGSASGSIFENIELGSSYELTYSSSTNSSESYIGGLVGEAQTTSFDEITLADGYNLTYNGTAKSFIGGIVGIAKNTSEFTTVSAGSGYTLTYNGNRSSADSYMGGIVGQIAGASFSETTTDADYSFNYNSTGKNYMGGIAGSIQSGTLSKTGANVNYTFTNTGESNNFMGGIAGHIASGSFEEASALDNYTFDYTGAGESYIGGMFGIAQGTLSANGAEIGANYTFHYGAGDGTITNYGASYMGGIIAKAEGLTMNNETPKTITSPTFNYEATGESYIGGVAGIISNSTISNFVVKELTLETENTNMQYLGGVSSKISNSNISKMEVSDSTLSVKDCGYVGGIAGVVDGSTVCTFTDLEISGCTLKDDAINKNSAVGGLIGRINAPNLIITGSSVDNATVIESNYVAGGLIGIGKLGTISNSTNNAKVSAYQNSVYYDANNGLSLVSNNDLLTSDKDKIYAGGIVGNLTSGTILNCTNNGEVKSGTETSYNNKNFVVEQNQYEPYAGGIAGFVANATLTDCVNNGAISAGFKQISSSQEKLNNEILFNNVHQGTSRLTWTSDFITAYYTAGSTTSYAGGIAGFTNNSIYSKSVLENSVSNYGVITSKAKQTLSLKFRLEEFLIYRGLCYYGIQDEKGYANGITYTTNRTLNFETTKNNGTVIGGEKIEFNMFCSNEFDLWNSNTFRDLYILDYGFDSNEDFYNSFAIYNDINAPFFGGLIAWKNANSASVLMVGADTAHIAETSNQTEVVKWGDRSPISQGNLEPLFNYEEGWEVYYQTDAMGAYQLLHYYETENAGEYELKTEDGLYGGAIVSINSENETVFNGPHSGYNKLTTTKTTYYCPPDSDFLNNRFYSNPISNVIAYNYGGSKPISLLGNLNDTINGNIIVKRNTSKQGQQSLDVNNNLSSIERI